MKRSVGNTDDMFFVSLFAPRRRFPVVELLFLSHITHHTPHTRHGYASRPTQTKEFRKTRWWGACLLAVASADNNNIMIQQHHHQSVELVRLLPLERSSVSLTLRIIPKMYV